MALAMALTAMPMMGFAGNKGPEWLSKAVAYQIYPSSYQDSDGDGIPDVWERQRGLDPADAADGAKIDPASGYTWLECYLNSLVGPITDRQNNQEKS